MKKQLLAGITTGFIFLCTTGLAGATTIDTTINGYDDSGQIKYFGNSGTDVYGQTFNIGNDADTQLNSVSFAIQQSLSSTITFDFSIYEWTGTTITGSALFTQYNLTTTTQGEWEDFLIDNIGITLSNNTGYVFAIDAQDIAGGYGIVAATPNKSDLYSSGSFVYSSGDLSHWSDSYWGDGDLAFVMQTSSDPIPEPATMLLLGTGLAGLIGSRIKRRKR